MHTNDFEKAFGDFLERREYDQAQSALFSMVRVCFIAGWLAAGGESPQPHKIFELVQPERSNDDAGSEPPKR